MEDLQEEDDEDQPPAAEDNKVQYLGADSEDEESPDNEELVSSDSDSPRNGDEEDPTGLQGLTQAEDKSDTTNNFTSRKDQTATTTENLPGGAQDKEKVEIDTGTTEIDTDSVMVQDSQPGTPRAKTSNFEIFSSLPPQNIT